MKTELDNDSVSVHFVDLCIHKLYVSNIRNFIEKKIIPKIVYVLVGTKLSLISFDKF